MYNNTKPDGLCGSRVLQQLCTRFLHPNSANNTIDVDLTNRTKRTQFTKFITKCADVLNNPFTTEKIRNQCEWIHSKDGYGVGATNPDPKAGLARWLDGGVFDKMNSDGSNTWHQSCFTKIVNVTPEFSEYRQHLFSSQVSNQFNHLTYSQLFTINTNPNPYVFDGSHFYLLSCQKPQIEQQLIKLAVQNLCHNLLYF